MVDDAETMIISLAEASKLTGKSERTLRRRWGRMLATRTLDGKRRTVIPLRLLIQECRPEQLKDIRVVELESDVADLYETLRDVTRKLAKVTRLAKELQTRIADLESNTGQ